MPSQRLLCYINVWHEILLSPPRVFVGRSPVPLAEDKSPIHHDSEVQLPRYCQQGNNCCSARHCIVPVASHQIKVGHVEYCTAIYFPATDNYNTK